MIHKVKRIKLLVVALLMAVSPVLIVRDAYAASATLSLSPGSTSVAKGAIVSLGIYVNGDEPVSVVKASLSYPTDKLDYVSVTNSGAFEIVAGTSGGGGNVTVDRGTFGAKSGRSLVATVRFRAKVDAGTANVAIASGDVAGPSNSNSNWLRGSSGANLTFKAPAAPTPAVPEPPKDTTPPALSDISVTDITHNSVTIVWKTSEPATSVVDYGLTDAYGFSATDTNLVTDHKVVLNSPNMEPGVEYHYVVKSADGAGNTVADTNKTFVTKGATLVIRVVDKKNKPLKAATVTIGSSGNSGTTDDNGMTTIENLQIGKVLAVVEYKGNKSVIDLEVKQINPDSPQAETLSVEVPKGGLVVWVGMLLAVLLLLGAVLFALRRKGHTISWSGLRVQVTGFGANLLAKLPKKKKSVSLPQQDTTQPAVPQTSPEPTVVKPTISLDPPNPTTTDKNDTTNTKK